MSDKKKIHEELLKTGALETGKALNTCDKNLRKQLVNKLAEGSTLTWLGYSQLITRTNATYQEEIVVVWIYYSK